MIHLIGLCYHESTKDLLFEEILKTEGIPYKRISDLAELNKFKGLVMGEGYEKWTDELTSFVKNGGILMVAKPEGQLAGGLGLKLVGRQREGYLLIEREEESQICSYKGPLQLFGLSNLYEGGEILVKLKPETDYGAIIRVKMGLGKALIIAFDLPETFISLQQPASESGKAFDASKVERELSGIPQLDIMRRLIVGLFLKELGVPVPRKWYFPHGSRALLVLSGDQDWAPFEQLLEVLNLMRELNVPYTLFVTPEPQSVSKEQFKYLIENGMDLGFHPNFFKGGGKVFKEGKVILTAKPIFTEEEFSKQLEEVEDLIGFRPIGCRCHGLRWETALDLPLWMERAGLQYDSTLGQKFEEDKPARIGYHVGTGLPYYFIDTSTYRRIDVLEIPMLTGDQMPFVKPHEYVVAIKPNVMKSFQAGLGLTEEEAYIILKELLDASVNKFHTAICLCFHPIYLASRKLKLPKVHHSDLFFKLLVKYAKRTGIQVMNATEWNNFWRMREKVLIEELEWDPESMKMSFKIRLEEGSLGISLLIPVYYCGLKAVIHTDGKLAEYNEVEILGGRYAMIEVEACSKPKLIEVFYGGEAR